MSNLSITSKPRCGPSTGDAPRAVVSLPVLSTGAAGSKERGRGRIAKSKMGPWRAAVLVTVHLIVAAHIIHWLIAKETISPVEPSESAYTLNEGLVNAGFVFFALAILSTAIFGRFFCGWGCHIVALQDLCGWMMKKCGVHPKPFKSRLLLFAPLILALYMFVWPVFLREVVRPLAVREKLWREIGPVLGESGERPKFVAAFYKKKFWETFPPWYVAIPQFAVVGFGVVYLLGAKGFCTYGCPYGGFFAPLDKIAPGKIRVTDACEHCGHCTAVCTSNVRVHEEVRDYGMVIDPGCMKCMDCISVCPNDALYFGLGMPSILAGPRDEAVAYRLEQEKKKPKRHELALWQEIAAAVLFFLLVFGFRRFLNEVPLLMSMGFAAAGVFFAWKLWGLARLPNVRVQSLQLKLKGRLRPAGVVFGLLGGLFLATGAWGAAVHYNLWRGDMLYNRVNKQMLRGRAPFESVLAGGYKPDELVKRDALAALRFYHRAGPFYKDNTPIGGRPRPGAMGWAYSNKGLTDVAYLSALSGDYRTAEAIIRELFTRQQPADLLVVYLARFMQLRGVPVPQVEAEFRANLEKNPAMSSSRVELMQMLIAQGRESDALKFADDAMARLPVPLDQGPKSEGARHDAAVVRRDAAFVYLQLGRAERGVALLEEAVAAAPLDPAVIQPVANAFIQIQRPEPERALAILENAAVALAKSASFQHDVAVAYLVNGRVDEARSAMQRAAELDPRSPVFPERLAQVYRETGLNTEADRWTKEAEGRKRDAEARFQYQVGD